MLQTFFTTVNAVVPVVLLVLLGYCLKRIKFLTKEFLKIGNKLVFYVCLPCMLFVNIYDNMNSFSDIPWSVIIYSLIAIMAIFFLGLAISLLVTKTNSRRGVIIQCAFRSNFAIIGLSLVERLGGDLAFAGIVSAFSIPVFNILAVITLTVFGEKPSDGQVLPNEGRKKGVAEVLLEIIKNPLIIGVLIGLLFVGIREAERACFGYVPFRFDEQLKFLYVSASSIKQIASPLALIVLGGQFEFSAVKGMTKEIIAGSVMRIVVAPLIGVGGAVLLSCLCPEILYVQPAAYPTLVALFGSPVAVSSAVMAGLMGGDEQLATQLLVWTCIGSVITIFITVCILIYGGFVIV